MGKKLARKKSEFWISVQHWISDYQWLIFLCYSIIVFVLAMVGLKQQEVMYDEPYSLLTRIQNSFQILKGSSGPFRPIAPLPLEIARIMAFFVSLFVGFKLFSLLLAKQWLLLRLRFISDHVIVFGLNKISFSVANNLSDLGYTVIVVDPSPDASLEKQCHNQGIVLLAEDPTDSTVFSKVRILHASQIYAFFENEAWNADLAIQLKSLMIGKTSKKIDVFVHIQNSDMCYALKGEEIEQAVSGSVNFYYFNLYELSANQIYQTIDKTNDILVVGYHQVLENLLLVAGKERLFVMKKPKQKKTWIMIDEDSDNRVKWLKLKYAGLDEVIDFIPYNISIKQNTIPDPDHFQALLRNRSVSSVLLFLPDYHVSIEWVATIQRLLRDSSVEIYFLMNSVSGISDLINNENSTCSSFKKIFTFDLISYASNTNIMKNSLIETIAQTIHGDYIRLQKEKGVSSEANPSIVSWDELPPYLQESNREQARGIVDKVRLIEADLTVLYNWKEPLFAFTEKELDKLSRYEHDRWMQERIKLGWQAGEKDISQKRTPYLVPFDELSEEIKELDRDTIRNIPYLLARNGLTIKRKATAND